MRRHAVAPSSLPCTPTGQPRKQHVRERGVSERVTVYSAHLLPGVLSFLDGCGQPFASGGDCGPQFC